MTTVVKSPYLALVFLTLGPALVVSDVESGQSARAGRLITKQALTKVWHSLDRLCLILQKASNGFDGVAILEFDGQRMLCQRDACRFLIICLQGTFQEGLKLAARPGHVTHVAFKDMSDMHP